MQSKEYVKLCKFADVTPHSNISCISRLTNSYLLKGESQPVCEACHSPLTVKHILVDCTHYSAARPRYFGMDTLKDLFKNSASRNIIAYVKDINFYNRI